MNMHLFQVPVTCTDSAGAASIMTKTTAEATNTNKISFLKFSIFILWQKLVLALSYFWSIVKWMESRATLLIYKEILIRKYWNFLFQSEDFLPFDKFPAANQSINLQLFILCAIWSFDNDNEVINLCLYFFFLSSFFCHWKCIKRVQLIWNAFKASQRQNPRIYIIIIWFLFHKRSTTIWIAGKFWK